jgi:hypothetical protein
MSVQYNTGFIEYKRNTIQSYTVYSKYNVYDAEIAFTFQLFIQNFFFYFIYRMYISRLHNFAALRPAMFPPLLPNTYKQGWEGVHSGQLQIGNCPTNNDMERKKKKRIETKICF